METAIKEKMEEILQKEINKLNKEIEKDINNIQKYTEGIHNRFEDWADVQDTKFDKFSEKIGNKIDKIIETVNRKSEMDSALIAQIQNLSKRVDTVEVAKVGYDKYIAELNVKVDHLINIMTKHSLDKMDNDIGSAHDKIRDHEDRIRPLEKKAGKQAIKLLWYIFTLIAGGLTGLLLAYLGHL